MTEENAVSGTETTESTDSLITENKALDFTERPEGFPDEFWNAEKNSVNIDALYKSWDIEKRRSEGLRAKLSKGEFEGKPPADIKEYVLGDEFKDMVKDGDPLYDAARNAAKEAGLPKEVFSKFMAPVLNQLTELQKEATREPTPEEREEAKQAEIAKIGPNGHKVVAAVGSYLDKLRANGTFTDAELKVAKDMVTSADAVKVFNKLRMLSGSLDQVPVDVPVDDRSSKSEIEAKLAQAFASNNEMDYQKYSAMLAKFN